MTLQARLDLSIFRRCNRSNRIIKMHIREDRSRICPGTSILTFNFWFRFLQNLCPLIRECEISRRVSHNTVAACSVISVCNRSLQFTKKMFRTICQFARPTSTVGFCFLTWTFVTFIKLNRASRVFLDAFCQCKPLFCYGLCERSSEITVDYFLFHCYNSRVSLISQIRLIKLIEIFDCYAWN